MLTIVYLRPSAIFYKKYKKPTLFFGKKTNNFAIRKIFVINYK